MIATLLGKKIGMTQVYDAQNVLVPVTVVEAGPCPVVQVKTVENDGYNAVQLGFGTTATGFFQLYRHGFRKAEGGSGQIGHIECVQSGLQPPRQRQGGTRACALQVEVIHKQQQIGAGHKHLP